MSRSVSSNFKDHGAISRLLPRMCNACRLMACIVWCQVVPLSNVLNPELQKGMLQQYILHFQF